MTLPHYGVHDDIEDVVTALTATGAVVIENLLPEKIVSGLITDLRPQFDREGHLYQNGEA